MQCNCWISPRPDIEDDASILYPRMPVLTSILELLIPQVLTYTLDVPLDILPGPERIGTGHTRRLFQVGSAHHFATPSH